MTKRTTSARKVIILGAASAIGEATARLYAAEGADIVIAGRNASRLEQVAHDLRARGASRCQVHAADLAAPSAADALPSLIGMLEGQVDAVLLFYGTLGDQAEVSASVDKLRELLAINFTSPAEWASATAAVLEKQRHGVLMVVGSVAGDRGRQSNYAYGSSKAGLGVFVQGIAHRLAKSGAAAVLVKPGFVDTPMTAHIPKSGPLWASADNVAGKIKAAVDRPTRPVVYVPGFWRWIMLAIRSTPARIFHKTNL